MPTVIKGQPTSNEVIAKLKAEDRPVLLAFSCGKDSLAAWCAMEDAGIEVIPAYLWYVPDLEFVDAEIRHYEDLFGKKIHRYPHPSFFRMISCGLDQPPARLRSIAELAIAPPDYAQTWAAIKDDLGLPQDTWVADGVRAADSIVRRSSFVKNGVMKRSTYKVSPIADMLKGELYELLDSHGVDLPIDYEIWGRSFDGIDYRFVEPMSRMLPNDYSRLCEWFPLIPVEIERGRYIAHKSISENDQDASDPSESEYVKRNRAEQKRRSRATDGNSVMCVCFRDQSNREKFSELIGSDAEIVDFEKLEKAFPESDGARRAQRPAEPRFGRLGRSPLTKLNQTASLECDSFEEASVIKSHIVKTRSEKSAFTDTDNYVCVWFEDSEHLDSFLKSHRIMRHGRLYLDGDAWMKSL